MSTGESEADPLMHMTWRRREIENYLCSEATLMAYAAAIGTWSRPLDVLDRQEKMREAIEQVCSAMETLGRGSPWSPDAKVSDDFLTPLFRDFFERLRLPNMMNKKNFHELADLVPEDEIDPEVTEKLDAIVAVAEAARPAEHA